METYTKMFASIVTSSIWTEDDKTRIVWVTLLAMADKHGEVHASIPGLARLAGVSLEACDAAIQKFLSPDPYSRTPDLDGRRLEPIEGGWALVNHAKYRRLASAEDSKQKTAERVRRHRERRASAESGVTPCNAPVTPRNGQVTVGIDIAEAEAEFSLSPAAPSSRQSDAEIPSREEVIKFAEQAAIPESSAIRFYEYHEGHNLWLNQFDRIINWRQKMTSWAAGDRSRPEPPKASNSKRGASPALQRGFRERDALSAEGETLKKELAALKGKRLYEQKPNHASRLAEIEKRLGEIQEALR